LISEARLNSGLCINLVIIGHILQTAIPSIKCMESVNQGREWCDLANMRGNLFEFDLIK